ncbi:MAG TPA: hypothetical protein VFK93_05245 [Candidatus Limnocylindria bacterium]|nr:hypothetical protein [Candidatus Limnocylindria bacterium]
MESRRARLLASRSLLGIGGCLVAGGLIGIVVAITGAEALRAQLTGISVDAAAVGGATAALASAILLLGVVHLGAGIVVRRGAGGWLLTAAIGLAAVMGALLVAFAVAAWVNAAAGGGAIALLGGFALLLAASGYELLLSLLIGLKRAEREAAGPASEDRGRL